MIPILPAAAWREYRGVPPKRGLNQTTHLALIQSSGGPVHKCYVKMTPPGWPTPLTEAIAWILSRALGLPGPKFAALIFVPIGRLSKVMPLDQHWFAQREALGFCAEAIVGKGLTHRWKWLAYLRSARAFRSEHVRRIAAFDEWVENQDRHEGNLIRSEDGDYVPIDNEFILHSLLWQQVFTVNHQSLLKSARTYLTVADHKRMQVEMVVAARAHGPAMAGAVQDIERLINMFQATPALQAQMRTAIVSFLTQRSQPNWMSSHLGVIA